MRHLLDRGRSRIACCSGRLDTPPGADRLAGYRAELERAGLPYRDEHVVVEDFSRDGGRRAMRRFLSLREPPDAVFAAGDLMAVGAMQELEAAGLRVPDDVAVVGFDDVEAASLVRPALTTIRQDRDALARAAVAVIGDLLDTGEEADRHRVCPVELVVRESTAGWRP